MIVLPQFLEIERGILSDVPQIIEKNNLRFNKTIVLFDKNTYKIIPKSEISRTRTSSVRDRLHPKTEFIEVNDSSKEYVDIVRKRVEKGCCIFGVGGGKVIDVGKYAASLENVDFISIPTCLSNDGICSPVAVIDRKSLGAKMPIGLIADLDVIQKAPIRNIRAGIGDLISNLSAVEDWRLASSAEACPRQQKFDPFSALIAETGAFLVLNDSDRSRSAIKPDIESYSFLKRLVYGLVLSGIAMAVAGSSRPCSGGEHEISHAIDVLYGGKALHGEQVAVGTIFILSLQKSKHFKRVKDFFKHCGVPIKYSDIGLTEKKFIKAVLYAPETRKGRWTILEKLRLGEEGILEVIRKVPY